MTLNELYRMKVERMDGRRSGYVLRALAEGTDIRTLVCADEDEREFAIDTDKIINSDGRIVYERECPKPSRRNTLRAGTACFDERGKFLGMINDYNLNRFRVVSANVSGRKLPFDRLHVKDVAVFCDRTGAPTALAAKDMFLSAIVGE